MSENDPVNMQPSASKPAWSKSKMTLHIILSIVIPIYGFIVGGFALKQSERKRQGIIILILAGVCLVWGGISIALQSGFSEEKAILTVKDGTLANYPNSTIGAAFKSFVKEDTWTAFKGDDGFWYVTASGDFFYLGDTAKVDLQFKVDPHDSAFTIQTIQIDDTPGNVNALNNVLFLMYQM
ncbi:MAG: hypothetical protein CVU43_16455 [Chloroflexi bacterium HGW-Chloroflexi-5]|jgi:hypothetical protein|nr:MAG: hypothetical protein CVV47_15060 [Spirochaetae bacterium HGW-Spirochaetae-3]PKN98239.1 MAG: hypothetical protein CVU43_16455 [Chloroflexi bacterium HGW-Chloroflexi-5]